MCMCLNFVLIGYVDVLFCSVNSFAFQKYACKEYMVSQLSVTSK